MAKLSGQTGSSTLESRPPEPKPTCQRGKKYEPPSTNGTNYLVKGGHQRFGFGGTFPITSVETTLPASCGGGWQWEDL